MAKFLGPTGLTVLWSRIKAWVKRYAYITSSTSGGITTNTITIDSKSVIVPSKTSDLNNDAGFITGADIPEGAAASSATPLMDGTASAGTSNAFARGDHRHPTDTTRQATITGGASTITSTNLTASRALVSNSSGKVAVSDVTSTELGYLDGVTSNVLTQLDNKANKPSGTITAGHVATLDANGNLVDSGVSTSDIGTDTKNTTGSTNDTSKMYVIGAKTQAANPQTYSRASVYIGADGKLRSGFGINSATDAQSIVVTASDITYDMSTAVDDAIAVIDKTTGKVKPSGESFDSILEGFIDGINGINANDEGWWFNYAICNTDSDNAAKTATLISGSISTILDSNNLPTYKEGTQIVVKFANKNTESDATLNINNVGAKEIHINGGSISGELNAGALNNFVLLEYDGSYWNIVGPATTSSIVWDGGGTVFDQNNSLSGCLTQLNGDMQTLTGRAIKTVAYDTTTHTITTTKVPTGSTAQNVVTAAQIVTDGGGLTSSNVGQANGVASLDANGKVPTSQLPSYVDDVVEAYIVSGATALGSGWLATGSASGTVITPETGVIYIIMNGNSTYPTNSEYRWSGSTYVQLYDGGCTEMTESEMNIAVMGSDTSVWT